MEEKRSPSRGIVYKCVSCGALIDASQLALIPEIKCTTCGYRVLRKVRPPIVKRMKAR
ncbi:MAG: RNA polymerase Rbp10 [Candidatus Bathyarchaeia archaeon]